MFSETIAKVTGDAVNAELLLTASDGDQTVTGIINGHVQRIQLAVGEQISTVFKASSVILAVE
jgi:molybdopterin-binding protein